jgi:site-specific DNA recombinase
MHIAIITRASKDRDDKRISVERQKERCEALASELFQGTPTVVYEDNDVSGADSTAKRKRLDAFLTALRSGQVSGVVTHEQSRITRIPEVWEKLTVALSLAGIDKVHTVQQGIIAVGAGNRLVGRLLAIVDAEEVERTRARVLAAHKHLFDEGRWSGTKLYGYRSASPDEKADMVAAGTLSAEEAKRPKLVINETEAEVVRYIADKLIAGYGLWPIVKDLNARGVPCARGAKGWQPTTLRAVIRKPAVAGLRMRNDPATAAPVTAKAQWEPILSEQRWQQAVRQLGAPTVIGSDGKRRAAPRSQQRSQGRRWLLTSGLALCSQCHQPLTVAGVEGGRSYACSKVVSKESCGKVAMSPAEEIEQFVADYVFAALEKPKMAKLLNAERDPERERLLAQLSSAEELMDEAAELRGAGVYDKRQWEKQFLPAKANADAARAALAALPDPDVELPPLDQLRERWGEMPLKQRRAFLDRCVGYVEIKPAVRKGRYRGDLPQQLVERVHVQFRL